MIKLSDKEIFDILDKHFSELKKYINVLNVNVGDEVTAGKRTGRRAIVVYVSKKLLLSNLKEKDRLPMYLKKVPVDVIELLPKDYKMGDTSASNLIPSIQNRIASGVKNEKV